MTPLFDNVAIEPLEGQKTTPGGLLLPDADKEPQTGKVVAVGPGSEKSRMILAIDDTVVYKRWAGTEVKIDNKSLILIKQEDVLAKL